MNWNWISSANYSARLTQKAKYTHHSLIYMVGSFHHHQIIEAFLFRRWKLSRIKYLHISLTLYTASFSFLVRQIWQEEEGRKRSWSINFTTNYVLHISLVLTMLCERMCINPRNCSVQNIMSAMILLSKVKFRILFQQKQFWVRILLWTFYQKWLKKYIWLSCHINSMER